MSKRIDELREKRLKSIRNLISNISLASSIVIVLWIFSYWLNNDSLSQMQVFKDNAFIFMLSGFLSVIGISLRK